MSTHLLTAQEDKPEPSTDWVTDIEEGYRTKTIKVGNATVTIRRPILDDEERARREERVREALRDFFGK